MTFQKLSKLPTSLIILLIIVFSLSSFKRKKKAISLLKIYKKERINTMSNDLYNFNLKTVYFWKPCSGPPPMPAQLTQEAREYDSLVSLKLRIKQVSCSCVNSKADLNYNNYRKCDSLETIDKIYRLSNGKFKQKIYDSMGYTPPLSSYDETTRDKEIEMHIENRIEKEWFKINSSK